MTDKITIFKEVFDYYYDGEITKEQLADLLLMHYETRWGDGVDAKEIEDKDLRMIWRTLQHSVIKSTKNAKQYEKQQNKKSAFQEVKEEATEISHISPSEGIKKENDIQIPNEDLKPTEAIKSAINDILPNEFMDGLENATEKSNITTEDIKEIMGNYIGEVEKLNNKTTGENSNFDFESIDRLIPKINKEMVLKQIKPYLSKEKNIGRLNDALSIFLKDVSLDDRTKYYEFLLEQSFAVA